jgi:hypothetical protein
MFEYPFFLAALLGLGLSNAFVQDYFMARAKWELQKKIN